MRYRFQNIVGGFSIAAVALLAANANAAPTIVAGSPDLTYSGTEGPFNSLGGVLAVPANLALNPTNSASGPTAFASSIINGGGFAVHQIRHLNDGNYSNSRSWIGGFGNENNVSVDFGAPIGVVSGTVAGIDLKGSYLLTSIAFGSDNGNFLASNASIAPAAGTDANEDSSGADTGFYHDRTGGTYGIQYTTSATPASAPDSSWTTLGGVTLVDNTNDSYRHVYSIPTPVTATGVRIFLDNGGNRIDEIEVYGSAAPEPTSLTLIGLGSLGLLRRRRA